MVRQRIRIAACTVLIFSLILSSSGCKSESKQSVQQRKEVVAATTLLATMPSQDTQQSSLGAGDSHMGGNRFLISGNGGYAYIAERSGSTYVVHNGREQNPFQEIGHLTLSPDGQHVAYSYRNGKRCIVIDGIAGVFFDDVWQPVFSPDSRHVAYIAQERETSRIVIGKAQSSGVASYVGDPVFNSDSTRVAYVESEQPGKNARLIVSDLNLKPLLVSECTNKDLVTNTDKTRIAAVGIVEGKQRVIVIDFAKAAVISEGPKYDAVLRPVFGSDGSSVVCAAQKGKGRYLVYNGQEQRLPDDAEIESLVIHPDRKGVGAIISSGGHYSMIEAFVPRPRKGTPYDEATGLTYSRDGSMYAYIAAKGRSVFTVANGKEGPVYDFIVSPLFYSPDGKYLVYRARKDGRRFMVVTDTDGKVIRQHPDYEQVFPPVFTTDGKSVAYGVKDGLQLWWKVESLSRQ